MADTHPASGTDRLLTYEQLRAEFDVPFSRQHLYTLEARGQFPKRIKLGERTVRWRESAICAWWAERDPTAHKEERRAAAGGAR